MIPEAAARLSRRSMVAAAVAAVGTGCSTGGGDPSARQAAPGGAATRLPGATEQAQAVRDSTRLLRQYDAAAAAHPALAARLRPLRAEVARHIAAFGGTAPVSSPGATAGKAATEQTPPQALAALAAAERALADSRATALLSVPGGLARLLASVAAAGAGHAALLGTTGTTGSGTTADTLDETAVGPGGDDAQDLAGTGTQAGARTAVDPRRGPPAHTGTNAGSRPARRSEELRA